MGYKAVFLDRDGVINEERKDYVKDVSEFKLIEGSLDAIKLLKEKKFLVIIITNQSAINRGLLPVENLNKIHELLKIKLNKLNTFVDGIYFCPHTPEENCDCRKPRSGLLLKAAQEHNIDLKNSLMIGDSQTDILAAKNAGCNCILLKKNQRLVDLVREFAS